MNYSLFTVDWDWLTSHKDANSRVEAFYRKPKDRVELTDFALASSSMWMELSEILAYVAAHRLKKSEQLIHAGLLCLMSFEKGPKDDLGLTKVRDSQIFLSLSPASVADAVRACSTLDFRALEKAFTDEDLEVDSEPEELESYLEGVVMALNQANAKKRGIVGHWG
jgi:hypothetical protein